MSFGCSVGFGNCLAQGYSVALGSVFFAAFADFLIIALTLPPRRLGRCGSTNM
jgi:hypothetical protein